MNYYPFHVGDYLTHSAHLSPIEDIAYRRLLDLYYISEAPPPADVALCARKIRMREYEDDVRQVLEEFFTLTDDGWRHSRCDQELELMQDKQSASEEKAAHERERMRRHRERRAEMFEALRLAGITPSWDMPITELQRLHDVNCNKPETHLKREQVSDGNAPATAIPIPTPTPIPTPIVKRERVAKRASALPGDFLPNEVGMQYAEKRRVNVKAELESFANWHTAKGSTMKDWQAAWRTWCDKAVEFGRAGGPRLAQPGREQKFDPTRYVNDKAYATAWDEGKNQGAEHGHVIDVAAQRVA